MADCTWTDKEMLSHAVERKFLREILIIILNQVIQNIITVRCLDASAAVVGCFFQRGYHMTPQAFRERKVYA